MSGPDRVYYVPLSSGTPSPPVDASTVAQCMETWLSQATANEPEGRASLPLAPGIIRGLRTLLAAPREVLEVLATLFQDPRLPLDARMVATCRRSPHVMEEIGSALDAVGNVRLTTWATVCRILLAMDDAESGPPYV